MKTILTYVIVFAIAYGLYWLVGSLFADPCTDAMAMAGRC